MSSGYIDALYNTLFGLCEIRGQLDPESNKVTEEQITYISNKIKEAEAKECIND